MGKQTKTTPAPEKLTPEAQAAIQEPSTIIVGKKVDDEWQLALLLNGVFHGNANDASLPEALSTALMGIAEKEYPEGTLIQLKIDVVVPEKN